MAEQPLTLDEIIDCLERVDSAFHNLDGLLTTLTLLSDDLDMVDRSPKADAFWSVVNAGRSFVVDGIDASNAAHLNVKRSVAC
jgi:hypothetical protein